jgi:hypothetical protein
MRTYGGVEVKLHTFLISALEVVVSFILDLPLTSGERAAVLNVEKDGWVPESVWILGKGEKSMPLPRVETQIPNNSAYSSVIILCDPQIQVFHLG